MPLRRVILLETLRKKGKVGDVVSVKGGFARYLFNQKNAIPATEKNLEELQDKKQEWMAINAKNIELAKVMADKVSELSSITIKKEASDSDSLYGSVSAHDIFKELKNVGIEMRKTSVQLSNPIKVLGEFTVPLELHPEVIVDISINIVRSSPLSLH